MNDVRKEVCSYHNLYKATAKSKKNVGWKDSVARFYNHSLLNVYKLKKELDEDTYKISPYSIFEIHEPKRRIVSSTKFKDRVFQKSLCDNYLYKEITQHFIENNCACQLGKGTDKARNCLFKMMIDFYKEYGTNGYALKLDIHDYFGSTDHEIAIREISKYIRDDWARQKVVDIINSFEGDKGIGLGSQISQLIQLALLNGLDHTVTKKYKIKYYVRYMDDIILLCDDKEYLRKVQRKIYFILKDLKLELNTKKTQIIKITQPIHFLGFGYLLHENGRVTRKLLPTNVKRRRRKLRKQIKKIPLHDFEESYKCWRAFVTKGDSRGVILKMDKYKESLIMDAKLIELELALGKEKAETEFAKDKEERCLKINEAVCKEFSLSTQIAIIRKGLASMGCAEPDFVAFNARVEEIKKEIE